MLYFFMFVSIHIFSRPIRVSQFTQVFPFSGDDLIFNKCNYVNNIFPCCTLLNSNACNIPGRFKSQDIFEVAWFDSIVFRLCNITAHIWFNITVIYVLLVVVETIYSIVGYVLMKKSIYMLVGNTPFNGVLGQYSRSYTKIILSLCLSFM